MNFIEHTQARKEALVELNDTYYGISFQEYLSILTSLGFKPVLELPFSVKEDGKMRPDKFFIFWRNGILLVFDTFRGNLNGGQFYYNYRGKDDETTWSMMSSGYTIGEEGKRILVGYHDCREALKHKITRMEAVGQFLPAWVEQPHLWLLHHGDTNEKKHGEYDADAINAERFKMLSEEVQKAITP